MLVRVLLTGHFLSNVPPSLLYKTTVKTHIFRLQIITSQYLVQTWTPPLEYFCNTRVFDLLRSEMWTSVEHTLEIANVDVTSCVDCVAVSAMILRNLCNKIASGVALWRTALNRDFQNVMQSHGTPVNVKRLSVRHILTTRVTAWRKLGQMWKLRTDIHWRL